MKEILYCSKCDKFTLKETCTKNHKTASTKPARFSPQDKYGKYRRMAKNPSISSA